MENIYSYHLTYMRFANGCSWANKTRKDCSQMVMYIQTNIEMKKHWLVCVHRIYIENGQSGQIDEA